MNKWNIDTAHSEIGFKIKHLMISTVRGRFNDFDGSIMLEGEDFAKSQIEFTAQAASIDTKNEMRDGHLKSAEFFNTAEFPTLSFKSKEIVSKGDHEFTVKGDLTMHGITKEISLETVFNGITADIEGNKVMSFDITGTLNRIDFDLTWNKAIEAGGFALSDEVKLDITAEFKEVK